ncbi:hypothetical protein CR513_39309, partial [Mucuna pruriens]
MMKQSMQGLILEIKESLEKNGLKLKSYQEDSKIVEEYHKEMEVYLLKAQLRESKEAIMARFLHELHSYRTLEELVNYAIKVELQSRGRSASKRSMASGGEKKGSEPFQSHKQVIVTPSSSAPRTSNIKYLKCLGQGHIAS